MSAKMDRVKMLTFKVTEQESERYRRLAVRHSPGAAMSEVIRVILDQACEALGVPLPRTPGEYLRVEEMPLFHADGRDALTEALERSRRYRDQHAPEAPAPAPPRPHKCVKCLEGVNEVSKLGFCWACQYELSSPPTPPEVEALAEGRDLAAQVVAALPELPPAEPPTPTLDRIVDHATGRGESAAPSARKLAKINRQRAEKESETASNGQKQPVARAKGKPAAGKPAGKPKGQKKAQKGRK